jgi:NitT/TauT family transport system substrate-binding protein
MTKPGRRAVRGLAVMSALAIFASTQAAGAAEKIRVALGDVLSVETLATAIALARAKDRGVDYELTSFAKEDLAIQAVVNGQANIGIGTPYSVIQRAKVPLRIVFQMSRGVFFPVADKQKYPDWKSLNGQPFTFHSRGSGTEAVGNILAKREGITFGERNYVPGSENRIIAMLNGQIGATIVDLANKNALMAKGGDRFHVLPGLSEPASDEMVFASADWIKANQAQVDIIVEEFLKLWREMKANPAMVEQERVKRGLLADQPKEILATVDSFYAEAVKAGIFDPAGGGEKAAKADFDFYTEAGQLKGPASELKVEDFWDLGPLKRAAAKLGG